MRCAGGLDWTIFLPGMDAANTAEFIECLASVASIAPNEAEVIAQEALTADFDVIAFNEVFDNDAKDVLVDSLKGVYPNYISYFKEGSALEDSGLMIFSKFPFAPLPNTTWQTEVDGTTKEVAFHLFLQCSGNDCHADKGVALVRVQVDPSGNPDSFYTIMFTHFQSDEGHADDRTVQFLDSAVLVKDTLGDPNEENVLLIGDLNIIGDGGLWDLNATQPLAGEGEWLDFAQLINDPIKNSLQAKMVDGWATFVPAEDKGISYPSSEHRYDYIIANEELAKEVGCIQHMTVHSMGPSDHLAVSADINALNKFCNPNIAWHNPPLDTHLNVLPGTIDDVTRIANPGAMQWFFLDLSKTSTVSIAVDPLFDPTTGQGVDFEVYSPNDFSTPIPWYLEETSMFPDLDMPGAKKYQTPNQFYIRVFSPNRSWTGNYTIGIHEHDCSSILEACVLSANNPVEYPDLFTANQPLVPDDTAWFQIDITEQADSGAAQPLTFFVDGLTDTSKFDLELIDKLNPTNTITLANQSFSVSQSRFEVVGETATNISLFLRLARKDLTVGSSAVVGWQTPLTRMHGDDINVAGADVMRLVCLDETNGALGNEYGDDEIHLMVKEDGQGWKQVFGADYNCNNESVIKNVGGVFRFLDNIQIKIIEGDGFLNPDDNGVTVTVDGLPVDFFSPGTFPRVNNLYNWYKFEGGEYRFYFSLSHLFPLP